MDELAHFTLTFAATSDAAVRRTETVEAMSIDIAASDACEEEDGDWHLVAVAHTDMLAGRAATVVAALDWQSAGLNA